MGQFAHLFTERGYYGRRVLARDFEKHHKARMALDQRRDVRVVCSGEKVSFYRNILTSVSIALEAEGFVPVDRECRMIGNRVFKTSLQNQR